MCGGPVKVSVIVPVHNMDLYIEKSISSVLGGSFEEVEVVVINDGSTDDSESIILKYTDPSSPKYDHRVRYVCQENKGKASAVNRGIKLARGGYLTVLDADDELTSDSLALRYGMLVDETIPPKDLAIGGFEVFDRTGRVVGGRSIPVEADPSRLYHSFYLSYKSPFHMNACLFSRDLYNRVGPLESHLHRCQDIDYSLRLLKAVDRIAWVTKPVYRYRKYRGDITDRMSIRKKTLIYRSQVYWKNYSGLQRYVAIVTGVLLDVGKFMFEIVGNYTD